MRCESKTVIRRFLNLLGWDMKFQARYGFYLLYAFLTIFYTAVLFALPLTWRGKAASMMIFSDPAAMGLFFMGAIVLLEKSQRVTAFFAVTPLRAFEYVLSKVLSLNAIALVVAGVLAFVSGSRSILLVLAGTFLSGTIFTLCGVLVATKINSLNQFILFTVPVEVVGFLPAILHLFGITPSYLKYYPANACMDMVAGREVRFVGLLITMALIVILFKFACNEVLGMWQKQGGAKI